MVRTLRGDFSENVRVLFQRAGYHSETGYRGELAFIRRFRRTDFPRFHLYLHAATPTLIRFRIHLDHKRPSYAGSHAHSADYESPLLRDETERLQTLFQARSESHG